jgi:DNA polymerase I-like protein with 3'-5' exonuclease and polymerase domains
LIVENNKKAEEVKKEFFKEIGFEFNLNSSQQVADFMYNKLGIQKDNKFVTKKGKK